MIIKELKIWTKYLEDILNDLKTFELRNNDKDFQDNEYVLLREYEDSSDSYLNREVLIKIKKVYKFGQKFGLYKDFCIFSFKIIDIKGV